MRAALKAKAVPIIALAVAGALAGVGRVAAAGSPELSPTLSIHIHNYASVDPSTLEEAERVVASIFRKAEVGIRWVDSDLTVEGKPEKPLGETSSTLSHIMLSILPAVMMERLDVPNNAMGLTPGNAIDRQLMYVFYTRVEAFSQQQMRARQNRRITLFASKSTILGYAIAHELGHVLLNLEVHTPTGIMRGCWDPRDLQLVAYGSLLFTQQQAEAIRAEALRRNIRQESLDVARLESAAETIRMTTAPK